nr:dihydropteroate synthase [Geobacter sp.]
MIPPVGIPASRFCSETACLWTFGRRSFDFSRRPGIMGILNVTPDSFSDGNVYFDPSRAVARALEMEAEGADIIDIGGESTRPFAPPVGADEELRRVVPVVEALAGRLSIPISVDTYKAVVARAAVNAGAEIVNDVSGLTFDAEMAATVAETGAGLVVMHTRGTPDSMQLSTGYGDIVAEVLAFLEESLSIARSARIPAERVVVDPGIGFGKSKEGNLEILRRMREFAILGRPVLLGTSRKGFIGKVLGREVDERLFGTAATVALGVAEGASIFRVHDVKAMRDVADMAHAIAYPAD